MTDPTSADEGTVRKAIARGYTLVEDVVYIGLGLLLSLLVLGLLVEGFVDLGRAISTFSFGARVIDLLDKILTILLVVELLYTVQVSFRAHALAPDPFLLVGLISAVRRILLLTAEVGEIQRRSEEIPITVLIELGVLTALIVGLAGALVLLRRSKSPVVADRT